MSASKQQRSPASDSGSARKRLRMTVKRLGIVKCLGGGVRVLLSWNDSECEFSVIKGILTCKDDESDFCRKFRGYKHDSDVNVNGQRYGKFSYRWLQADSNDDCTAQVLAELFRASAHVKTNPRLPYAEGNMKFAVEVLNGGEALPMGGLYSDNDIVNHCTSEEQKYALWRIKFNPFAQNKDFFWSDAGHDDLADTIQSQLTAQNTAANVNGITF